MPPGNGHLPLRATAPHRKGRPLDSLPSPQPGRQPMTRSQAIAHAEEQFDSGAFRKALARRIAIPTDSQDETRLGDLARYLDEELIPEFEAMGFETRVLSHKKSRGPFLFAQRIENAAAKTVLGYGHGD